MARIRTIKPEFFTSEDIVELSPLARLFYIALWCEADKEGRLEWKLNTFKLRYLPADACDINALAHELLSRSLVVLYGDGLAYIPAFKAHQHINPRESNSKLPEPDASARVSTRQPRVSHASATRQHAGKSRIDPQVGREGKGKEVNPPLPPPTGGEKAEESSQFAHFWELWPSSPRKVAKAKCAEKWRRASLDRIADQIIAHVGAMKGCKQWRDGFEPSPLTYLNQRRWEDDVGEVNGANPGSWVADMGLERFGEML